MRFVPGLVVALASLLVACSGSADLADVPGAAEQLVDDLVDESADGPSTVTGLDSPDDASPGTASTDEETTSALASDGQSDVSSNGTQEQPSTTGEPATPSGAAPSQAPRTTPSPTVDTREMGPGIDGERIVIGFHNQELAAAAAAVGATQTGADERRIADALVAWLNSTGGIAGREVVAVHHDSDTAQGSWAVQAQAACATFTQDNQVFAALSSSVGGDDSLLHCLADTSTPLFDAALFPFDEQYFTEFRGLLYRPGQMLAERWVRATVDVLADEGFLDGATIGLVTYDRPVLLRLSDNVLKPRLEALGITVVEQVVTPPGSVSGMGATGAEMNSAVIRFRAAGVNRVLFLQNGGTAPFLFFNEAEAQGFRPRYALTSNDSLNSQRDNAGPEQLTGAMAVGWNPPNDMVEVTDVNDVRDQCNRALEEAGASTDPYYALPRCDALLLLRDALERAPALTTAGLLAAVEGLGTTHRSPFTIESASEFGPSLYAGATLVRPYVYDVDCECFLPSGSPRRAP